MHIVDNIQNEGPYGGLKNVPNWLVHEANKLSLRPWFEMGRHRKGGIHSIFAATGVELFPPCAVRYGTTLLLAQAGVSMKAPPPHREAGHFCHHPHAVRGGRRGYLPGPGLPCILHHHRVRRGQGRPPAGIRLLYVQPSQRLLDGKSFSFCFLKVPRWWKPGRPAKFLCLCPILVVDGHPCDKSCVTPQQQLQQNNFAEN